MRKFTAPVLVLALMTAVSVATPPSAADARPRHRVHRVHHNRTCEQRRSDHARNGTIIGAVGGGIVANSMARGNRTGGTLLGAGVGALAGNAVGRGTVRC